MIFHHDLSLIFRFGYFTVKNSNTIYKKNDSTIIVKFVLINNLYNIPYLHIIILFSIKFILLIR